MIIRGWGKCATCDHPHTVRAGVGIESYQEHYFDCGECGSNITVALRTDPPRAWITPEENFINLQNEEENSTLINLHPNFAFTITDYHSPSCFVSLEQGVKIIPHIRPTEGKYKNDLAGIFEIPNCKQIWSLVKRAVILEGKDEAGRKIDRIRNEFLMQRQKYRPETKAENTDEMITSFFTDLLYPRITNILEPAIKLIKSLKQSHPYEVQRFIDFYNTELKEERTVAYLNTFSDYFRYHGQFTQLLSHARLADDDIEERIIGSKSFDQVKLYYGQAFEVLTTSISTLAAFNNVLKGRPFDQFESMTWAKYNKDVEKAKRSNPFQDVTELSSFTACLDSTLRNGSHHGSIWRDGEKVYYRSGGTGERRELPYSGYIHRCNKATISLAAIWLLELRMTSLDK